jgi:hypothetical protein
MITSTVNGSLSTFPKTAPPILKLFSEKLWPVIVIRRFQVPDVRARMRTAMIPRVSIAGKLDGELSAVEIDFQENRKKML